jgi:hypothetical protein
MNANLFMATTGRGLARAIQGSDGSWSVEFSHEDHDVRCLAIDPLDSKIVYA